MTAAPGGGPVRTPPPDRESELAGPGGYLQRIARRAFGAPRAAPQPADGVVEVAAPPPISPTEEQLARLRQLAELDFAAAGQLLDAAQKPADDLKVGFYISVRALSYVGWDLFSREAYLHFARVRPRVGPPPLSTSGFRQGA